MYNHQPDNLEKAIRFGCGGILGFIFGISVLYRVLRSFEINVISTIVIIVSVLIFGIAAMKYGDKFWINLR